MKNENPFIVIDVESNGLYGQPFCVGAVVMDPGGRVLEDFIGRCPIDEVLEDFVEEKVVPALDGAGVKEDMKDLEHLQTTFISWRAGLPKQYLTYVDVGFPVDVGFLRGLYKVDRKQGSNLWHPPYPLLDVASQLAAFGTDPLISREEYAKDLIGTRRGVAHDPRWDAEMSGLCVVKMERFKAQVLLGKFGEVTDAWVNALSAKA